MPVNDLSAFNATAWAKKTLMRLDQINVMLPLVNKEYEGEIKSKGSTVYVRTYGNVTMTPYQRGVTLNYEALAPVKEPLTVNDAQSFAFMVDDLDDEQSDLPILDGYAARAAVAIDEQIDAKCLSKYALAHPDNQISAGSATTLSTSNAYTLLVDAGKCLDDQKAPQSGRWAVIGPNWKSKLLKDTSNFIRATDMGDQVIRSGKFGGGTKRTAGNASGFIGQMAGFDIYLSNGIPNDPGGAYPQFGAGPVISYAGQIRKIKRITLESTHADAVRGLLLHDATVFAEHAKAYGTWYVDAA